jgi:hypothetical protein
MDQSLNHGSSLAAQPTPGGAPGSYTGAQPAGMSSTLPGAQTQATPVAAVSPPEAVEGIVTRAKLLMSQSQANPYHQSNALQLLKAQYIAERYNINLKITQD